MSSLMPPPVMAAPTGAETNFNPSSEASPRTRVLIVEDHPLLREGLRRVLDEQPDFSVCGEASSLSQALEVIAQQPPDIAVLDLTLEGSSGLELLKELSSRMPQVPVIVLSNHDEMLYAERCLRAGARGYVMKGRPIGDLLGALRLARSGRYSVSEAITARLLTRRSGNRGGEMTPLEQLTDRELQIFERYGQGHSTRRIAGDLHLSIKTVESHRERIKAKLGLTDTPTLTRAAVCWVTSQSTG